MRALLSGINATRLPRLLLLRWLTQTSDGLFQVGLASFVLFSPERSPSALAIATGFALILLPYSGIGPFVGTLLDRYHRRTVIISSNLIRTTLLTLVAILVWQDSAEATLAPFVLLSFGLSRLTLAGFSAGLPRLVPTSILVPSNALAVTGGTLAAVIGGGIGVGIRSLNLRDQVIIFIAALLYTFAATTALRLRVDELGPHEEERHLARRKSVWRSGLFDVRTAAAFLIHNSAAATAIMRVAVIRGSISALIVVAIITQRDQLGEEGSLSALALMAALMGVGSLAGAVLAPQLVLRMSRERLMNLMMIFASPWALLLVTKIPTWVAMTAIALCGQAIKVTADAQVQQTTDDELRGRVFALYDVTVNVAIVIGAFVTAVTLNSPWVVAVLLLGTGVYFWRSAHH